MAQAALALQTLSPSPTRCNTMAMKITKALEKKMHKPAEDHEGAEEEKSFAPIKPPKAPWKECGWCGNRVRAEIALRCAWCWHTSHRYCYQAHRPCRGEDDSSSVATQVNLRCTVPAIHGEVVDGKNKRSSEAGQKMQCNDYNFDDFLNDTAAEEARRRKA